MTAKRGELDMPGSLMHRELVAWCGPDWLLRKGKRTDVDERSKS